MSVSLALDYVALAVMAAGSAIATVAYGSVGSLWRTPFGRFVVAMCGVVELGVIAKAVTNLIINGSLADGWPTTTANIIMAVLLGYQAWVFILLRRDVRRGRTIYKERVETREEKE